MAIGNIAGEKCRSSAFVHNTATKDWGQSFPFRNVAARYLMGWTTKPAMKTDRNRKQKMGDIVGDVHNKAYGILRKLTGKSK